jgi:hypothetical protein
MPTWPDWWDWDVELTPHVERRMEDRDFTEVDLRRMLERATSFRHDVVEERYVIATRHNGRDWEVIVEPDAVDRLLVVITAYAVGSSS